jgi:hypothetical protein
MHLARNRHWISTLIDTEFQDYARDVAYFLAERPAERAVKWPRLVVLKDRTLFKWKELSRFKPLENLLVAYAFETRKARIEWLGDQLRMCRMSRSVSVALTLLCLEAIAFAAVHPLSSHRIIWAMVLFVVLVVAILIMRQAYSRICLSLFSTVYVQVRLARDQNVDESEPSEASQKS